MPHPRYDNALERRLLFLERVCVGVIADIVVLTGGTQTDEGYLSSGCAIRQIPNAITIRLACIASTKACLGPKRSPARCCSSRITLDSFDKWAMKNGPAFKANGQVFTHAL